MTSKEALFNLVRIHYGYESKNDFDECVKVLEKDLERLEILKDKLSVYIKADYCLSVMGSLDYQQLTKEEYKLLKEWLNENNN